MAQESRLGQHGEMSRFVLDTLRRASALLDSFGSALAMVTARGLDTKLERHPISSWGVLT
jgi:hypothetical protein